MIRQRTQRNLEVVTKIGREHGFLSKQCKYAIKILCEKDIQLFSLLFLKHYNVYPHNQFHIEAFELLESSVIRLAVAASRGLAKSSTFSLVGLLHDICYKREQYVILFSDTDSQALSHSKNLIKELTENNLVIEVFGKLLGNQGTPSDFVCSNGVKVSARGSGCSVRGLRHGSTRPTKLILDDVEDDETANNPRTRANFEDWFTKAVTPLGDGVTTKIHFIGTVLNEEALLVKTQANPMYTARTYKMILSWSQRQDLWDQWTKLATSKTLVEADQFYYENYEAMTLGTSVMWPEKSSYLDLQKEILEIGLPSFLQEKQMEAIDISKSLYSMFHSFRITRPTLEYENGIRVDPESRYIELEDKTLVKNMATFDVVMAIDPTTGAKNQSTADCCAISVSYVDKVNKRVYVFADWTKPAKVTEWIEQMLVMSQRYKVNKIYIEENACRGTLESSIRDSLSTLSLRGTLLPSFKLPTVYKVTTSVNKEQRLYQLEPRITNGTYRFIDSGLSNEFWAQLKGYRAGSKCRDDVPDSLEHIYTHSFESGKNCAAINPDLLRPLRA